MAEKYQIFVSSTYEDLKHERDRVVRGILELGHIPVGMEMFSAADEEQWKTIARHIEQSDYYVVILAHRYGSIVDGISYTRREYEFAVSKGIPVVGFIIDSDTSWPPGFVDTAADAVQGLSEFKQLVSSKPVGFWTNADDLYGKSSVALVKAFNAQPRTGWVRATSSSGPEVTAEISRLSAENASLRTQLQDASLDSSRSYQADLVRDLDVLRNAEEQISVRYVGGSTLDWEEAETLSLGRIFAVVVPLLVVEESLENMSQLIALHARPDGEERQTMGMAINLTAQLLTDLMAFDLVAPSAKKHAVSDKSSYWTLTKRGVDLAALMTRNRLRASASGQGSEKNEATERTSEESG